MKMNKLARWSVALAVGICSPTMADDATKQLIKQLKGEAELTSQREPGQLEKDYASVLQSLLPDLGGSDLNKQKEVVGTLEAITNRASRPGAEVERAAWCKAMAAAIGDSTPLQARLWLLRHLERIGRDESVDQLAKLIEAGDGQIRTRAIAALAVSPADAAGNRLRAALASAQTPQLRVELINALALRRDERSVRDFAKLVASADPQTAAAAAAALGQIANREAAAALARVSMHESAPPGVRTTLMDSYLRTADRLAARGVGGAAVAIYSGVLSSEEPLQFRLAALRGLVLNQKDQQKAAQTLLEMMNGEDWEVQSAAARLVAEIPDDQAVRGLTQRMSSLPPRAQASLIGALAERSAIAARGVIIEAAAHPEQSVRLAALAALGKLGDEATVEFLARTAGASSGAEQAAARESLARLRGEKVEQTILAGLVGADPKMRAELLRAISGRRMRQALPKLLDIARTDADEAVRIEALNAIAELGMAEHLDSLVRLLAAAKTDKELSAAESAVGAVMARLGDPEQRAAPVLTALGTTEGKSRLALLRVSGRTGSDKALTTLRSALKDPNEEMQLAAVRAMGDWPDMRALPDLLSIAKESAQENQRVLAVRGYVKIVGLPSSRKPQENVLLYSHALPLARAEEKKQIIAGLGNAEVVESFRLVAPLLAEEPVRNEAASALLKIGRAIEGNHRDEVADVARKVLETVKDENMRKQAQAVIDRQNVEGFIKDWLVSGPYQAQSQDLFGTAFPPEQGQEAVRWKKLPANPNKERAWEADLNATDFKGDNRTAYLRTGITSPKQQEVQLEVGSDDGVKVWLNGKLVHEHHVSRPNEPGQDKFKVILEPGLNVLMLKVVNGAAGWGASARFRTVEGRRLDGLKIRAEAEDPLNVKYPVL